MDHNQNIVYRNESAHVRILPFKISIYIVVYMVSFPIVAYLCNMSQLQLFKNQIPLTEHQLEQEKKRTRKRFQLQLITGIGASMLLTGNQFRPYQFLLFLVWGIQATTFTFGGTAYIIIFILVIIIFQFAFHTQKAVRQKTRFDSYCKQLGLPLINDDDFPNQEKAQGVKLPKKLSGVPFELQPILKAQYLQTVQGDVVGQQPKKFLGLNKQKQQQWDAQRSMKGLNQNDSLKAFIQTVESHGFAKDERSSIGKKFDDYTQKHAYYDVQLYLGFYTITWILIRPFFFKKAPTAAELNAVVKPVIQENAAKIVSQRQFQEQKSSAIHGSSKVQATYSSKQPSKMIVETHNAVKELLPLESRRALRERFPDFVSSSGDFITGVLIEHAYPIKHIESGLREYIQDKDPSFALGYIGTVLAPLMWSEHNIQRLKHAIKESSDTVNDALKIYLEDRATNPDFLLLRQGNDKIEDHMSFIDQQHLRDQLALEISMYL